MKLLFLLLALLPLCATSACKSASGGAPVVAQIEWNGEGIAAYDINSLFVIADGQVSAMVRDAQSWVPLVAPLSDSGNAVWVRIQNKDGARYAAKFDRLPPPEVTVLPADLALFGTVLLTPQQLAQYRVTFAAE